MGYGALVLTNLEVYQTCCAFRCATGLVSVSVSSSVGQLHPASFCLSRPSGGPPYSYIEAVTGGIFSFGLVDAQSPRINFRPVIVKAAITMASTVITTYVAFTCWLAEKHHGFSCKRV